MLVIHDEQINTSHGSQGRYVSNPVGIGNFIRGDKFGPRKRVLVPVHIPQIVYLEHKADGIVARPHEHRAVAAEPSKNVAPVVAAVRARYNCAKVYQPIPYIVNLFGGRLVVQCQGHLVHGRPVRLCRAYEPVERAWHGHGFARDKQMVVGPRLAQAHYSFIEPSNF